MTDTPIHDQLVWETEHRRRTQALPSYTDLFRAYAGLTGSMIRWHIPEKYVSPSVVEFLDSIRRAPSHSSATNQEAPDGSTTQNPSQDASEEGNCSEAYYRISRLAAEGHIVVLRAHHQEGREEVAHAHPRPGRR